MSNGTQTMSEKMKKAGQMADASENGSESSQGNQGCGSPDKGVVTIELLGKEKAVIRYQKCTLIDKTKFEHHGETSPEGICKFQEIPEGSCFFTLDGIDWAAWGNSEKERAEERDGPIAKTHSVVQGEDLDCLAYQYGFHPETIWMHKANKSLRDKRDSRNVLKEGDKVQIPEVEPRKEKIETGEEPFTFYRKGVPALFKVRFTDDDGPRKEIPYIFKIITRCGTKFQDVTAKTDKNGMLKEAIPPNTTEGEIILNPGEDEEYIPFRLGYINPVDDGYQGVQSMLNNMGYYCGDEDDVLGEQTISAVREFQRQQMKLAEDKLLPENAKNIDEDTLKAIEKKYSG